MLSDHYPTTPIKGDIFAPPMKWVTLITPNIRQHDRMALVWGGNIKTTCLLALPHSLGTQFSYIKVEPDALGRAGWR